MENNQGVKKEMARYRPATDIIEKKDGFHLYLDMPGVSKDKLNIDLNDNSLRVSAAMDSFLSPEEKQLDQEFFPVEYVRSFTLSDVIDRQGIQARFTNGVLDLFLPKVEKAQPKKIAIQPS